MGRALVAGAALLDVTETVRAAGGIVGRRGEDGVEHVLVVHRPAYDDWTFPKGKLEPGEDEPDAAVREVEEETGLLCRLEEEIGTTRYHDRHGRPKTVRYWLMSPIGGRLAPGDGVDEVRYVTLTDAKALLSYPRDVDLVEVLERSS
jgi:8-oxo-dGTP pyrophosphatase MutT (NUDIX family)